MTAKRTRKPKPDPKAKPTDSGVEPEQKPEVKKAEPPPEKGNLPITAAKQRKDALVRCRANFVSRFETAVNVPPKVAVLDGKRRGYLVRGILEDAKKKLGAIIKDAEFHHTAPFSDHVMEVALMLAEAAGAAESFKLALEPTKKK